MYDRVKMWLKAARVLGLAMLVSAAGLQMAHAGRHIKLVALGDSLTAGLGLAADQAFPRRLEIALSKRLATSGVTVEIANAGVSGDTAGDGLARLDWSVPDGTDGVILALGANDMLRGLDPATTAKTLEKIVSALESRHIQVLLAGMEAPGNFDQAYRLAFNGIFADIAARHHLDLYPFLLAGVALDPKLNQDDGLHPNARGAEIVADRMLDKVLAFIAKLK